MKATITIEIEGNPEEINTVTKSLQTFMRSQPTNIRMTPRQNSIFPLNRAKYNNRMW